MELVTTDDIDRTDDGWIFFDTFFCTYTTMPLEQAHWIDDIVQKQLSGNLLYCIYFEPAAGNAAPKMMFT